MRLTNVAKVINGAPADVTTIHVVDRQISNCSRSVNRNQREGARGGGWQTTSNLQVNRRVCGTQPDPREPIAGIHLDGEHISRGIVVKDQTEQPL